MKIVGFSSTATFEDVCEGTIPGLLKKVKEQHDNIGKLSHSDRVYCIKHSEKGICFNKFRIIMDINVIGKEEGDLEKDAHVVFMILHEHKTYTKEAAQVVSGISELGIKYLKVQSTVYDFYPTPNVFPHVYSSVQLYKAPETSK